MADESIELVDGKYTVVVEDSGGFSVLRHSEPWIRNAHMIEGARCWYALAVEALELRQENARLRRWLKEIRDTRCADASLTEDRLRDLAARALAAPAEREGWRPIETAPKDGSHVLLWRDEVYPARWIHSEEIGPVWLTPDGHMLFRATHWMPAPSGPIKGTEV